MTSYAAISVLSPVFRKYRCDHRAYQKANCELEGSTPSYNGTARAETAVSPLRRGPIVPSSRLRRVRPSNPAVRLRSAPCARTRLSPFVGKPPPSTARRVSRGGSELVVPSCPVVDGLVLRTERNPDGPGVFGTLRERATGDGTAGRGERNARSVPPWP